tara:strand:+ start:200 stop:835 length:636 start_codon:yes stop_codon:yes gene_type:complete
MPLPDFLVNRYKDWRSTSFKKKEKSFIDSIKNKQKPKAMIISCCDSRVLETNIFDGKVGDFFIHKNIANLVKEYNLRTENNCTASAIEYAIKELNVPHIVILGHSNCGGIKYVYDVCCNKQNQKKYEFIYEWVKNIQEPYNNLPTELNEKNKIELLEKESIKLSIKNLYTYPFIKKLIDIKSLEVHGLWYDIAKGKLFYLNIKTNNFEEVV